MNAVTFYSELFDWVLDHVINHNMFVIQSIATCCALTWLLFRAWQTLWKPVHELIAILGVEVPDPPKVSLAGIKSDSITLYWLRPDPQKPVTKYYIQVNGLNVGETSKLETAITVTGLMPLHFYNVTVISVGSNNFQAGSLVIRLRTYGKDGRPVLDGSLDSPNLDSEDFDSCSGDDETNNGHAVCVEATTLTEGHPATNINLSTITSCVRNSGQRRNTGGSICGRRHSPSTASAESAPPSLQTTDQPKESMQQLTEHLENINRERDKIALEMAKEAEDFKFQFTEICRERDEKKLILKEKEEASEKLKKEVNHAERLNRQAQTRKSQKEKLLKEKLTERSKIEEDMKRWKKEIEDMKSERCRLRVEREKVDKINKTKIAELKENIKQRQAALNTIEEDIRVKGLQIKQLEKHRKRLLGSDEEDEIRLRDEYEDREWDLSEKAMTAELNTKSQQLRDIGTNLHQQQSFLSTLQQRSSMICQGYYSGIDYDSTLAISQAKPRSSLNRKSQTIPPIQHNFTHDSNFNASITCNSSLTPNFAPGPYIDMSNDPSVAPLSDPVDDMTDEDYNVLAADAPFSPTAKSLLPSNIFADDNPPSPNSGSFDLTTPVPSSKMMSFKSSDPNSPSSPSSYPASLLSSPQNSPQSKSVHGIQNHEYMDSNRLLGSPNLSLSANNTLVLSKHENHKEFRDISLPRPQSKDKDQDEPLKESLKHGQSNSLPQFLATDFVAAGIKHRRITIPSSLTGSQRTSTTREQGFEGKPSTPGLISFSRGPILEMLGSNLDEQNRHDSTHASKHSHSVGSFDLPRPSTDSAPFGWGPAQDHISNRNSILSTDWSIYAPNLIMGRHQSTWSNNISNQTNFQHSLSTAFLSGIAHDDDNFLSSSEAFTNISGQQSVIGVIGTRQSSIHQTVNSQKLNPAAPAFQGVKSNSSTIIDKNPSHDVVVNKLLVAENKTTAISNTQSGHTKSSDCLDLQASKTLSEAATNSSGKEKEESSLQRLFRKGSSSRFSISSFRNKDSSLFSGKKSVTIYSDQNSPYDQENCIEKNCEDSLSKSLESDTSSTVFNRNPHGESVLSKDRDNASKEGRISMNWSRFGRKGKKGRESWDNTDIGEEIVTNSET